MRIRWLGAVLVLVAAPLAADPLWSQPEVAALMFEKEAAERAVVKAELCRRLELSGPQRQKLKGLLGKLAHILAGFAAAPESRSAVADYRTGMVARARSVFRGNSSPGSAEIRSLQRYYEITSALEAEIEPIQESVEALLEPHQIEVLRGFDPEAVGSELGLGGEEHWEWADHLRELRRMSRADFDEDGAEVLADALDDLGRPERLDAALAVAREARSLSEAAFEARLGSLLGRIEALMEGGEGASMGQPAIGKASMSAKEEDADRDEDGPGPDATPGELVREYLLDPSLLVFLVGDESGAAQPGRP